MLLTIAALGCSNQAVGPAETFVVGFQDSRVRNMSLEEPDARGIWYERVDDNAIRFRPEDLDVITRAVEGFSYEVLPPDRSVYYIEPIQKEFLKRLDEAGIEYEVTKYGDLGSQPERGAFHTVVWPDGRDAVEWIVWSAEDSAEVERIQEALEHDLMWGEIAVE